MIDRFNSAFRIFLLGSFLIFSGCGSDSGPQQSSQESFPTAEMTGAWEGTATGAAGSDVRNIALVLEQSGSGVSGSYTCSAGTVVCIHTRGTFSASVVKSTFTGGVVFTDITPSGPSCTLHGSVAGDTLTADYTCNATSREGQGTWNLTRQDQ